MKTIIFKGSTHGLNQTVQVKGGGLNKVFHTYSGSKLPGSFLLESSKTTTPYRVYCMLLDYAGWRFAIAPAMDTELELKDHLMDIKIDYTVSEDPTGDVTFILHIPEHYKAIGEGEFRE
jgi:hypothetical protein